MRRRLLISYLTITVLVLLVLEIPLGISFAQTERRRLEEDVRHDAFALAIRAEETLEGTAGADLAKVRSLADGYTDDTGGRVVIVDATGRLIVDSDPPAKLQNLERRNFASRPEIARALAGEEPIGTRHSDTLGADVLYAAVPVASSNAVLGAVRVTYPLSFETDRIRHNWLLLAATGGVAILVVFGVSLWLARSVSRPLADLERAASRLGSGDLAARAPVPSGPVEVRLLAEELNTMAVRLAGLVGAQREFVADASHQLRTPLAALRLRLENLETEVDPSLADDLEGARAEVDRLSQMVDGLLALARAEQAESTPMSVDVGDVVAGRQDSWSAFATERGVQIELRMESGLRAWATPGRLEQILDNLLNNALEVAPRGSAVTITGETREGAVELRIGDAGPGMTADQRTRAFDRFWRAGTTPGAGGFGLGLAIVRQLVTTDGGSVELATSPEGGLEVRMTLRAAR